MEGQVDARIALVADRQRGRISRWQLRAASVSDGAIAHRIAAGRLHPRRTGVFAVGYAAAAPLTAETEALLCVPAAVGLSHRSAAVLWGALRARATDPIDVLVPGDLHLRRPGLTVHRSRIITPRDLRIRDGLPVTSPAFTALDLADTTLTDRQLERAVDELRIAGLLSDRELLGALHRADGRLGAPRLHALLDARRPTTMTRSDKEELGLSFIRAAGLPAPHVNARLGEYEVDFYWPAERVVLEIDTLTFHTTRLNFERDRRKDRALRAQRILPIRATERPSDRAPARPRPRGGARRRAEPAQAATDVTSVVSGEM